jgi:hypothetical protein
MLRKHRKSLIFECIKNHGFLKASKLGYLGFKTLKLNIYECRYFSMFSSIIPTLSLCIDSIQLNLFDFGVEKPGNGVTERFQPLKHKAVKHVVFGRQNQRF